MAEKIPIKIDSDCLSNNTIRLYAPGENVIRRKVEVLNKYYDATRLGDLISDIKKTLGRYRLEFYNANGVRSNVPAEWNGFLKNTPAKKEKSEALAFFICEPRNVRTYFSLLPEPVRRLWIEVLIEYRLSVDDVGEILGAEVDRYNMMSRSRLYWEEYVDGRMPFFGFHPDYGFGSRSSISSMKLLPFMHMEFAGAILPEAWVVPDSEPAADATIFNGEVDMSGILSAMDIFHTNGVLKLSQSKVSEAVIKKISSSMPIPEFYASGMKGFDNLRAVLVTTFFGVAFSMMRRNARREIKAIFDAFIRCLRSNPPVFYSLFCRHIKQMSQRYRTISAEPLMNLIVDTLRILPRDRWIPIGRLFKEMTMHDSEGALIIFGSCDFYGFRAENRITGAELTSFDIIHQFAYTAIRTFVALLGAIGGAEVAFGPLPGKPDSYFLNLTHFRLTELGEYMLGFRDSYEMKAARSYRIELSPDSLIITVDGGHNPLAGVVSGMAASIGHNRFRTDSRLMLRQCESLDDVLQREKMIENMAGEMPDNWKEFFRSLKMRCEPLESIPTAAYKIFRIDEDNVALQNLLCSDPELSNMVIRAEGYLILVGLENLTGFRGRLAELGYIL